ncbi:MAG: carbohydrate porin [Endomicrobium sp.]|nr:carbohydrate porin [Endomicrobium sp.]
MKKLLAAAAALFFAAANVLAADILEEKLGVKVSGGGTIILQATPKSNDGSGKGLTDESYTFDLKVEKEFSNGAKARIHLEGGAGRGLSRSVSTYSSMNADADPTVEASINNSLVKITELWYEQSVFDGKFTFTLGKLNNGSYFDTNVYANDETSQFLTSAFVSNQIIAFPARNGALRLTFSPAEIIDVTYGYFASSVENMDTGGFNIAQITLKPIENGNYRIYYWASNSENGKFRRGNKHGGSGFGLSLDQALTEIVGLFARFGYSDPKVYERSLEWSFGAQVKGQAWNRENDKIGAAIGQIANSSDWSKATGGKKGSETHAELYYSYALNGNFAITPVIQYFENPSAGNAASRNNVFVYGIRTQINF